MCSSTECNTNVTLRFSCLLAWQLYVDDVLERADLETVAAHYLRSVADAAPMVPTIVQFYLQARHLAQESLLDGGGQKPHYSLRTLCRALRYAKELVPLGEYNRVSVSFVK